MTERPRTQPLPSIVAVGQVWEDRDPRGGPTFKVVDFTPDGRYALTERKGSVKHRKVRVDRIPRHYRLLSGPGA